MSVTVGFEERECGMKTPGSRYYLPEDVNQLLAHARALEAMLKRVERVMFKDTKTEAFSWVECPICNEERYHAPDCQLAKLLECVE